MSKRKILSLALTLCMVAILAVGGTLAYFTDTEAKTNVFTVGNVNITLNEIFTPDTDTDNDGVADAAKLFPGVDVTKEVTVTNDKNSEQAYVRVHLAFPAILDSGSEDQPEYASYNNTLHWNFLKASYEDGKWNYGTSIDAAQYPGNGGEWNCYTTTINEIPYNVYVVTYETALNAEETTSVPALTKVYLDTKVTNEGINEITKALGGEIKVYVAAEGTQTEGFTDAFDALNTSFGVPGEYTVNWTIAG